MMVGSRLLKGHPFCQLIQLLQLLHVLQFINLVLFALRNNGGHEAVAAIIDSLGSNSALLRHEVAYVFGQLQSKAASSALSDILKDVNEHPMVRHEATEAPGDQSVSLLEKFAMDSEPIVSQSCEVAVGMLEFEQTGKSFEYLFMQAPPVQWQFFFDTSSVNFIGTLIKEFALFLFCKQTENYSCINQYLLSHCCTNLWL
ncbi:Coatomer beta subunit [Parasponia andersonii]|uniref:Coatomer beta subunit n=1 Tax=Parasponia andersonii TaxID=3476 RepID=A0A2P5D764_PARAD|nr:Coatomer beta subunit [Parasponia andersonii]